MCPAINFSLLFDGHLSMAKALNLGALKWSILLWQCHLKGEALTVKYASPMLSLFQLSSSYDADPETTIFGRNLIASTNIRCLPFTLPGKCVTTKWVIVTRLSKKNRCKVHTMYWWNRAIWNTRAILVGSVSTSLLGSHMHFGPFAVKQGTEQRNFFFSFFMIRGKENCIPELNRLLRSDMLSSETSSSCPSLTKLSLLRVSLHRRSLLPLIVQERCLELVHLIKVQGRPIASLNQEFTLSP